MDFPQPTEETYLFSVSDFKHVIKKWQKPILKGALICSVLAASFTLLRPLNYTSEATFYEKPKNNGTGSNKSAALLLFGEEQENSAVVLLKSRKILEAAIVNLNLQATIKPYSILPDLVVKAFERLNYLRKNLIVEAAYLRRSPYPAIEDPEPAISAVEVNYNGEIPLYFDLYFTSNDTFTINNSLDGIPAEGTLGKSFNTGNAEFTLVAPQTKSLKSKHYVLTLKPLRELAEKLENNLKVVSDYKDKAFISLTLNYPSREGTSRLLNAIMKAYRDHLLLEHHEVVASQVDYLKQRRQTMDEQLAALMHNHGEQISAHAGSLDLLVATQQNLQKRLLNIDLETKHIQQALDEGSYLQMHYSSDSDSPLIHQTLAEIRRFRQQCDSLVCLMEDSEKPINLHLIAQEASMKEFQGIDLETANTLYISYCRELQETEASAIQNQFIIDKIQQPNFELSSLAAVLTDPVSCEIVKKAGTLSLTIKDQDNRTHREIERLSQDLEVQRSFLTLHLKQIVELLKLRVELLRAKVHAIQLATHELLQKKISIQETYVLNYAVSRLKSLKHEQALINQQKQTLQLEFDKLPEQWAAEKLVNLYLKTDGSLMEHIGSLIESKNIADHLEMSLSAPFDFATPPLHPKWPALFIYALVGALMGTLAVTLFAVINSIKNGVDATASNLTLIGEHVAGTLSNSSSDGLETLRRLMAQLCPIEPLQPAQGHSLLLLENHGPNYAPPFATLLSKRNLKVLLMSISPEDNLDPKTEKGGLLDYLEGTSKEPLIIKGVTFDQIHFGRTTPYCNELLESSAFQSLLEELRKKYDWIVAISQAPLFSSEAETAVTLFDGAAITLKDEKLHDLKGYFHLPKKISFLFDL
jgi:uncharacterized protein involved in exopolysaccharide biosynthesis